MASAESASSSFLTKASSRISLELAAYIYAADRHTRRGSRDAVEFHAWSRRFRFRIKVRDVEFLS